MMGRHEPMVWHTDQSEFANSRKAVSDGEVESSIVGPIH